MQTRSVNDLTIRQLINQSELICRELSEHLKQNFAPRAQTLARVIHSENANRSEIDSKTIHQHLRLIEESNQFSRTILVRFESLIEATDQSTSRIIDGN